MKATESVVLSTEQKRNVFALHVSIIKAVHVHTQYNVRGYTTIPHVPLPQSTPG